jgi:hypothetical protein
MLGSAEWCPLCLGKVYIIEKKIFSFKTNLFKVVCCAYQSILAKGTSTGIIRLVSLRQLFIGGIVTIGAGLVFLPSYLRAGRLLASMAVKHVTLGNRLGLVAVAVQTFSLSYSVLGTGSFFICNPSIILVLCTSLGAAFGELPGGVFGGPRCFITR